MEPEFLMPKVPDRAKSKRKAAEMSKDIDPMEMQFSLLRRMPLHTIKKHYVALMKSDSGLQTGFPISKISYVIAVTFAFLVCSLTVMFVWLPDCRKTKKWDNTDEITYALARMIRKKGGVVPEVSKEQWSVAVAASICWPGICIHYIFRKNCFLPSPPQKKGWNFSF